MESRHIWQPAHNDKTMQERTHSVVGWFFFSRNWMIKNFIPSADYSCLFPKRSLVACDPLVTKGLFGSFTIK